jgi:hypothetical protein
LCYPFLNVVVILCHIDKGSNNTLHKEHMLKVVCCVPIIIQKDATIYSLFISANYSTCFGWYRHPSSEAHITVSTVSGIIETVTATCHERDWMGVPFQ